MKVNDPEGLAAQFAVLRWAGAIVDSAFWIALDCFGLLSCVACYLRGTRSSNAATAANLTGDSRKKNAVKDR